MNEYAKAIQTAASSLSKKINTPLDAAIVIGSGLSAICDAFKVSKEFAYQEIEGLSNTSAPSHEGRLLICQFGDKNIAICQGRLHLYEGHSAQQVAMLTYVLNALGAQQLIVTNAAGALNADYRPRDIMVINDHINFTGHNPIVAQDDSLGQRFADMSQAYSRNMAANALRIGSDLGLAIHSGVYAGVAGPSLETSAERRMFRQWGADAVGMSTVMEVIAANHCGMQVLGLSAITNLALGDANQQPDTIEQVLEHAAVAATGIKQVIETVLSS